MKNLFCIVLVLMLVAFTGCGGDSSIISPRSAVATSIASPVYAYSADGEFLGHVIGRDVGAGRTITIFNSDLGKVFQISTSPTTGGTFKTNRYSFRVDGDCYNFNNLYMPSGYQDQIFDIDGKFYIQDNHKNAIKLDDDVGTGLTHHYFPMGASVCAVPSEANLGCISPPLADEPFVIPNDGQEWEITYCVSIVDNSLLLNSRSLDASANEPMTQGQATMLGDVGNMNSSFNAMDNYELTEPFVKLIEVHDTLPFSYPIALPIQIQAQ